MRVRRATSDDRALLDELTLAGVRHWGHDVNHPEAFQGLIQTIAQEPGPEHHSVFVFEDDRGEVIGFHELRDRGDHMELLRMFLRPELIGIGYGRTLWEHAVTEAGRSHERLLINSDPGATGFYRAMGAELAGEFEPVPGFVITVFWHDLTPPATEDAP